THRWSWRSITVSIATRWPWTSSIAWRICRESARTRRRSSSICRLPAGSMRTHSGSTGRMYESGSGRTRGGDRMRDQFDGAAGDVTGSAYHVVTNQASILVDCGFFQGRKEESEKNRRKATLESGKLDAVVLTHGHLDHIGRLPLLTRKGYKGPIYATRPTLD